MVAYSPNPKVCINYVDYTPDTVNRITITAGRSGIDEQPRPSFVTASLIVLDETYPPIKLNDCFRVTVSDSEGVDPRLFEGYITDIERSIKNYGQRGVAVEIKLSAVGVLARLSRFTTKTAYSKEFDGDRIYNILAEAITTSWDEVNPTLAWEDVPADTTWAAYDAGYVGVIERPGTYELAAYSGAEIGVKSLTDQVANSALGVLYETPEGKINYDSVTSRITRVANDGFLAIPAAYLSPNGLASTTSTKDLANKMVVGYKNGQSVVGENVESQALYGLQARQKTTILENESDAQQQLDLYLATRAYPRDNLSSVTIPLHNPDLPSELRNALLGVYCGMPVSMLDIPDYLHPYGFSGFVENYSWTLTQKEAYLTLNCSDYGLIAIQQSWQQVSESETWSTISTSLTWENARTVA